MVGKSSFRQLEEGTGPQSILATNFDGSDSLSLFFGEPITDMGGSFVVRGDSLRLRFRAQRSRRTHRQWHSVIGSRTGTLWLFGLGLGAVMVLPALRRRKLA